MTSALLVFLGVGCMIFAFAPNPEIPLFIQLVCIGVAYGLFDIAFMDIENRK